MTQPNPHESDPSVVDAQARVVASEPAASEPAAPVKLGDALRRWWSGGSRGSDELMSAVRDEASLAQTHTEAYVRKEPVKAVAIAAASGAVLMGLIAAAGRGKPVGRDAKRPGDSSSS